MLHPAILRHVCIVRPTRKYLPRNYFPVSRTCVSVSAIISITAVAAIYSRVYTVAHARRTFRDEKWTTREGEGQNSNRLV